MQLAAPVPTQCVKCRRSVCKSGGSGCCWLTYRMWVAGRDSNCRDRKSSRCLSWCFCCSPSAGCFDSSSNSPVSKNDNPNVTTVILRVAESLCVSRRQFKQMTQTNLGVLPLCGDDWTSQYYIANIYKEPNGEQHEATFTSITHKCLCSPSLCLQKTRFGCHWNSIFWKSS